MKPKHIFLLIACLYIAGFFAHALYLQKTVYGDGVYYYSWLKNAVVDHTIVTPPPGNKYSIGPAILWAPGFLLVHSLLRGSGNELPYQLAVGGMSVLYALTGLLLLSRFVPMSVIAAIAGASNLLFYGSIDPVNSHALSFFAACVFLSLLYAKEKQWITIGSSLGLIAIIRPQDVLYGILCIPSFARGPLAKLQGDPLLNFRKFAFGFLIVFLPQLLAWYATTGSVISPYLTGSERFDFLRPHILSVLLSPLNGLFLWTPIVLLGVLGLKNKFMLLVIFLELYLVSSWSTWWQGASYSGRMFVSILPLIAFGVARRQLLYFSVILPLTLLNICLITYFLFTLT